MSNVAEGEEQIRYQQAIERLEEIVEQIESSQIDIDDLEKVVSEAVGLISLCRARLTGAQTAVEQALNSLKPEQS